MPGICERSLTLSTRIGSSRKTRVAAAISGGAGAAIGSTARVLDTMRAIAHVASMARRPLTTPRKHASQERSRVTVDALVEATSRLLVREGFDKASTNRIAEEAGVSVGSLYQYYPSKEALVAAVIDRHNRELMQVVRAALVEMAALPIEKAVRKLVAVAIDAHRLDPKLHRVLAEQIPRTGRLEKVAAFNREYFVLFKGFLESHREELRTVDLELAAFVCVTSIEALTHTAVLHRTEILSDEMAGTLVDEATRLLVGYLIPRERSRKTQSRRSS